MDGQDIIYSKWNPIVNGTKNWNIVLICHGFMGVEHAAVKYREKEIRRTAMRLDPKTLSPKGLNNLVLTS